MQPRVLVLQRADECVACGTKLVAGATAWWDARARVVTCAMCHEAGTGPAASAPATAVELDRGEAGASAAREYQRRKDHRETQVRQAHPLTGDVLLRVRRAPQHERAFRGGELGELAVGEMLDKRAATGSLIALHDRRMPRGRGNIDHIAIARSGVLVIDAKRYSGKVRVADLGFRGVRLMIAERDRTKLLEGLDRQVTVVREGLAAHGHVDVPVQGVLCFTTGDLPRFKKLEIRDRLLLTRRGLGKRLDADGALSASAIEAMAHALAAALPRA